MVRYSQRDPRWSGVMLGNTGYSVARYGCTVTDIAMSSDYFKTVLGAGVSQTPKYFAQALKFTPQGYLLWDSLPKCSRMKLRTRFVAAKMKPKDMHALILAALKDRKQVCLLQVEGNHWVLATGVDPAGGYKIADPWFGDNSTTKQRYKNRITGGAVLEVT